VTLLVSLASQVSDYQSKDQRFEPLSRTRRKRVSDFAYTYAQECGDGNLYMGSATDLKRRVKEHSRGAVLATRYRLPVELVYYEPVNRRSKLGSEEFS
jgi:hypothetical protein